MTFGDVTTIENNRQVRVNIDRGKTRHLQYFLFEIYVLIRAAYTK